MRLNKKMKYPSNFWLFFLGFSLMAPGAVLAWNLQGSCVGAPAEVNIGEFVTWTANQYQQVVRDCRH